MQPYSTTYRNLVLGFLVATGGALAFTVLNYMLDSTFHSSIAPTPRRRHGRRGWRG